MLIHPSHGTLLTRSSKILWRLGEGIKLEGLNSLLILVEEIFRFSVASAKLAIIPTYQFDVNSSLVGGHVLICVEKMCAEYFGHSRYSSAATKHKG